MAKLNIVSLADHINRTHLSFAGHSIAPKCANVQTFRELAKMDSYFSQTPSAVSCTFDAVTVLGHPSEITVLRTNEPQVYAVAESRI